MFNDAYRTSFWQAARATQVISLTVALVLAAVGMPPLVAVVHSLAIGNLISLLTHLGRWSLAMWQIRRSGESTAARENGWPGWGPMAGVIALSVMISYPLGSLIARLLLGGHFMAHGPDWLDSPSALLGLFVVSLIPAVAGTYYFQSRARLAATEAELAQAARQAAENRLALLQSQLEPHMLFNTLANLKVLVSLDPARAQVMLDHLIAFLRSTLQASRQVTHPLSAEFERLEDYLALMAVRMGERLTVELDLPPALTRLPVPSLLLQPLVENAIKHGLEPQVSGGLLRVRARQVGQKLRLEVHDSGAGLAAVQAAAGPRGTAFGLTQVRERLATLHGSSADLTLLSPAPFDPPPSAAGPGTLAIIELPIPTLTPQMTPTLPA
jgi:signal transduction histidine kinase